MRGREAARIGGSRPTDGTQVRGVPLEPRDGRHHSMRPAVVRALGHRIYGRAQPRQGRSQDDERQCDQQDGAVGRRIHRRDPEEHGGHDPAGSKRHRWGSIWRGAATKPELIGRLRHMAYAGGWKKLEPLWDFVIRARRVTGPEE